MTRPRSDPWLRSMTRCRTCGEMRPSYRLHDGECWHHNPDAPRPVAPTPRFTIAQRRDDLQIMIDGRETLEGAAERLGLSPASLERWCHRHARDLLPKLTRPDLGHVHQGRIARSA